MTTQELGNNDTDNNGNLNQSLHLDTQCIFMPIQCIGCKFVDLYAASAGQEKAFHSLH